MSVYALLVIFLVFFLPITYRVVTETVLHTQNHRIISVPSREHYVPIYFYLHYKNKDELLL